MNDSLNPKRLISSTFLLGFSLLGASLSANGGLVIERSPRTRSSAQTCQTQGRDGYAEAYASAFGGESWFNDISELDAHFVDVHENRALPERKRHFCAQVAAGRISERISDRFDYDFRNTLSFQNPLGPIGAGMCWLHSRLQRRFTYLANFRPYDERGASIQKPSPAEAQLIIDRIIAGDSVVEIPGFTNLNEFSTEYRSELTEAINRMGYRCVFSAPLLANTSDCFARVGDDTFPSTETLGQLMDQIADRALQQPGDVQFLRTRVQEFAFSGAARPLDRVFNPTAHSFLLKEITPIFGSPTHPGLPGRKIGYRLKVIDPNSPMRVQTVDYRYGDASLGVGEWRVIPYTHYEYDGDIPQMHRALESYCRETH